MKKIVLMVLTVSFCCIGQISMGANYTIDSRNSTGINVPVIAGKWMTIEASGLATSSNGTQPWVGPEGNRDWDPYVRNNYIMALIGLYNSDVIYIGPLFIKQFQNSGTIALLCNDNTYIDNAGSFQVVVNYYDNFSDIPVSLLNQAPKVFDVTASQRNDGSGIVDIYYTLNDQARCNVSVVVSDDGGDNYNITPTSLKGDLVNVTAGRRHIIWNSKADLPGTFGINYRVRVTAEDIHLEDGLVAYYPFNGNASDYSGNENHGIKYGATFTNDRFGNSNKALSFDGNDDYVSLNADGKPLNRDLTIAAWFRFDHHPADRAEIVFMGDSSANVIRKTISLEIDNNGTGTYLQSWIYADNNSNNVGAGSYLSANKWYYGVVTYDSSMNTVTKYLDGKFEDSFVSTLSGNLDELLIGKSIDSSNNRFHFDGKIDEVRIYNRALNSAEISQLYNNTGN